MTWSFLYLVALLIGLVLAAAMGLVARLRSHWHPVTLPHPEHHSAFLNLVGQRASVVLVAFGAVGLVAAQIRSVERQTTLLVAGGAAALAALLSLLLLRSPCSVEHGLATATVIRDIPAGGYGQVQLGGRGQGVVMAAKGTDGQAIAEGTEVELIDCQSSVLSVRAVGPPDASA